MKKEFLYYQRYRPATVSECVLSSDLKQLFTKIISVGDMTDMIFNGSAGVGKTSCAKALCNELDFEYYFINGALNGSIDTLRYDIQQFVSTVSFTSNKKAVIIDEADRMSAQAQDAFKSFMEEFSHVTYIFTTNNKSKIIAPIHSRCTVIDFTIPKDEQQNLLIQFIKRTLTILDSETVEYDKASVAKLVSKYFPDFRRTLNELQSYYIKHGSINSGILSTTKDIELNELYGYFRQKSFSNIRKWCAENSTSDISLIFRKLFDTCSDVFTSQSVPMVILALSKYDYQSKFAVDQEICLVSCFIEILVDAEIK